MIVKVCGMRNSDNIRQVEEIGIDIMGFIFWPGSVRYVSSVPDYLPIMCKRAGVFVDASDSFIVKTAAMFGLDYIQFHGNETAEDIIRVKTILMASNPEIKTIKAINIKTYKDVVKADDYQRVCDMLLFDAGGKLPGGNGQTFNWDVLDSYHGNIPFLLSGGIGPEDYQRVMEFNHPMCEGVDLNSKFEDSSSIKDVSRLSEFIDRVCRYR